jgi:predicted ATPase/DNA-binding SARP family transcriptional activator/class 3 adenylate cyclase
VASLRIDLLGGFRLRVGSGAEIALPTRKSRLLLTYLALAPEHARPRAELMALLWGMRAEPQARASLRQELHSLRLSLAGVDPPAIQFVGDSVILDASAVMVDGVEFERLAKSGGGREALEQASSLYHGDLLKGVATRDPAFEEWLAFERRRLRDLAIAVLGKLLLLQLQDHSAEAAAATARRLLELDEADEGAHRALMRLYARRGERNAALRQYQLCRAVLARELGVEPEEETERLRSELCRPPAEANAASTPPPMSGVDPTPAVGPMPDGNDGPTPDEAAAGSPRVVLGYADAPRAERRQLTVMFVDLVGSTALAIRLDPEELREVLGMFRHTVAEAITHFDGRVAQYQGDGVLACFGWPQAQEDAAEQAVRSGLAVVEAVARLQVSGEGALACRVGITTGLVVVDDPADRSEGLAVVGETLHLAARLQTVGRPGTVIIAEPIRRLLGELFTFEDLGPQSLKGFAAPMQAWRVTGPGVAESRFEALHMASVVPMVGREQELALLLDRWQRAEEGEGQVVLLSGEAGIGKSRIVSALRERLRGEQSVGMRLQCSQHHAHSALWPVIRHLEHAAGMEVNAAVEARWRSLAALLPGSEADLPLFAELLGIPAHADHPFPSLTPHQRKRRIFAALLDHLQALAQRQTVLLVLEDAQWLDPTTRELFDSVVEMIARLPVLLVVAARPDALPLWAGHSHATVLTLSRLSGQQMKTLIMLVANGRPLPAEAVEQIRARADGVPLFVEELTKTVVEAGPARAEPLPTLAIPATLQDSLMARLDRLVAAKEVAQMAACMGRQFSHDLVTAVASVPAERLAVALDQLVAAQLIFRRGTPPDAEYTFKHALLQEAAYQSMLKGRRQEIHAAIAHVLEGRSGTEGQVPPEIVAHHFTEAGLLESAVDWWLAAGGRAAGRSAMVEATAALRRAIDLLAEMPRTRERMRRELLAQAALGRVLITTHGQAAPETGRVFDAALELASQLEESEEAFAVLAGIFVYRMVRADLADALAIAERMLAMAHNDGGDIAALMTNRCLGVVRFYLGDQAEASHSLRRAIELYQDREHALLAQRFAYDPKAAALAYLGLSLLAQDRTEEAKQHFAQALAHAEAVGHLVSWANTLAHVGLGYMVAGDEAAVRMTADALGRVAAEQGFPYWMAHAAIQRGWLRLASDDELDGFSEGIASYRASGSRLAVPALLTMLAAAHLRHSDMENAKARLEEANQLAAETNERWYEPETLRLLAETLAGIGCRTEVELEFRRPAQLAT